MAEKTSERGDWRADEQRAIVFHETEIADAVAIWLDGFNLLVRGLDTIKGHSMRDKPEQRVMLALFIRTLNSLRCAYELATRSYYVQALNLIRSPVEDWMAYWYLRNVPNEHARFLDPKEETPPFNEMLQAVEARQNRRRKAEGKPAEQPDPAVRKWMKGLHQYSHLSGVGVRETMSFDKEFTY